MFDAFIAKGKRLNYDFNLDKEYLFDDINIELGLGPDAQLRYDFQNNRYEAVWVDDEGNVNTKRIGVKKAKAMLSIGYPSCS